MRSFFEDLFQDGLGALVFIILLYVIIWFITRELRCWYWKINRRIDILESIDNRLANIQKLMSQGNTVNAVMTGEISGIAASIDSKNAALQTDTDEELPEL